MISQLVIHEETKDHKYQIQQLIDQRFSCRDVFSAFLEKDMVRSDLQKF